MKIACLAKIYIYDCDNVVHRVRVSPVQTSLIMTYNIRVSPKTKLKTNVQDKSPECTPHKRVFLPFSFHVLLLRL